VASIERRELSDGTVRYRVAYRVGGKQHVDSVATADEAARHKLAVERLGGDVARALLHAREGIDPTGDGVTTVADYALRYVNAIEGITDGTRRDYRRMVARRIDGTPLGETPIQLVTRATVTAWLDGLGLAAKTRRNYHALLSAVLEDAARAGVRSGNPAKGVTFAREVTRQGVFLTPGDVAVIAAALPAHYLPLFAVLVGTGLRWSEATALTVADVDLDSRVPVVRVDKAWKRTGKGQSNEIGPPKSAAGLRTVGLSPEVADQLRPLVDGRPASALLFTAAQGGVIRHDKFHSRVWQPMLDRLNTAGTMTKRPRIHDLRHTHASQLMAHGVPLNVVQKRLGHEKITTTADTYGHLAPDYLEVAAAAASFGLTQAFPAIEG
jgi:integrase